MPDISSIAISKENEEPVFHQGIVEDQGTASLVCLPAI